MCITLINRFIFTIPEYKLKYQINEENDRKK